MERDVIFLHETFCTNRLGVGWKPVLRGPPDQITSRMLPSFYTTRRSGASGAAPLRRRQVAQIGQIGVGFRVENLDENLNDLYDVFGGVRKVARRLRARSERGRCAASRRPSSVRFGAARTRYIGCCGNPSGCLPVAMTTRAGDRLTRLRTHLHRPI